jgi:hypothetical protein
MVVGNRSGEAATLNSKASYASNGEARATTVNWNNGATVDIKASASKNN